VVDDFKPELIFGIVDRADIGEMVEGRLRSIVQIAHNFQEARSSHGNRGLGTCGIDTAREDREQAFARAVAGRARIAALGSAERTAAPFAGDDPHLPDDPI